MPEIQYLVVELNDACYIFGHFQGTDDFTVLQKGVRAVNRGDPFPGYIDIGLYFLTYFQACLQNLKECARFIGQGREEVEQVFPYNLFPVESIGFRHLIIIKNSNTLVINEMNTYIDDIQHFLKIIGSITVLPGHHVHPPCEGCFNYTLCDLGRKQTVWRTSTLPILDWF